VEKYLAARPTLILLRPQHLASAPHLWAALEKNGIKVIASQVLEARELFDYWRALGDLVGQRATAETMVAQFQAALAPYESQRRVRRPGVFLEAIHKEIKTFSPGSLPIWLVELAGGRNVAAGVEPAPGRIVVDFGPERLLSLAGEVDIYISQEGPMNRVSLETLKARELFRGLPAFQSGRVYKIPEPLLARPTPGLVEGLATLAGFIQEAGY
jgi:iron complex transport system substrate-binding protein